MPSLDLSEPRRRRSLRFCDRLVRPLAVPAVALFGGPATAADDPGRILRTACLGCHQTETAAGGLDLSKHSSAIRVGPDGRAAIVPGKPTESTLLAVLEPAANRPPAAVRHDTLLSPAERTALRTWIQAGARSNGVWPEPQAAESTSPEERAARPVRIRALAVSPAGDLLAVAGSGEVLIFRTADLPTRPLVPTPVPVPQRRLAGLSRQPTGLDFSPDGTRLAIVGGTPGEWGEVQLRTVRDGALVRSWFPADDCLYGVRWSPDGTRLAYGGPDHSVRVLRPFEGDEILRSAIHQDRVLDLAWAVDGQHLISASRDRSLRLTETAGGRLLEIVSSIAPGAVKGGLTCLDRHPTRDEVACGGVDGQVRIYRIFRAGARRVGDDDNKLKEFPAVDGRITAVRYSPDGSTLAWTAALAGRGQLRVVRLPDDAKPESLAKPGGTAKPGETAKPAEIAKPGNFPEAEPLLARDDLPPSDSVVFSREGDRVFVGGTDGRVRSWSLPGPPDQAPAEFRIVPAPLSETAADSNARKPSP